MAGLRSRVQRVFRAEEVAGCRLDDAPTVPNFQVEALETPGMTASSSSEEIHLRGRVLSEELCSSCFGINR